MKKIKKNIIIYLMIIAGSVITAFAINVFLVPYKIVPGGVSGIAAVIHHITGGWAPVGITMLIINIPLFILGYRYTGRKMIFLTLVGTVVLSLVIDITAPMCQMWVEKYFASSLIETDNPNLMLYAISGGILMGAGLGIVFRTGATTGGTDLAAKIISHFVPHISLGKLLLFVDIAVVTFAAVAFKSFVYGLYSAVALFASSKAIDIILEGMNFARAVFIISNRADIISHKILNEFERGLTALDGTGVYTGDKKSVLFCVLQRSQIPALKDVVKEIDPNAFIVLNDVREVLGEGFERKI